MRAMLESMIAKHSGRTEEQVRIDIERDKILTADEALDYGLIDRVSHHPFDVVATRLQRGGAPAPRGGLALKEASRDLLGVPSRLTRPGQDPAGRQRERRARGTHR